MKKLIIFIGKPGVGKTTLINTCFIDDQKVDVLPFIKRYEKDGIVPEEKTILAYREVYKFLKEKLLNTNSDVVLELGTNHAELNIEQIFQISKDFLVYVFLCEASIVVCRNRAIKRGRNFDEKALESRLNRNFPLSHKLLIENKEIKSIFLDTNKDIKDNILIINEFIA